MNDLTGNIVIQITNSDERDIVFDILDSYQEEIPYVANRCDSPNTHIGVHPKFGMWTTLNKKNVNTIPNANIISYNDFISNYAKPYQQMSLSEVKLKPCKFCNNPIPEIFQDETLLDTYRIECTCGIGTSWDKLDKIVKIWNV